MFTIHKTGKENESLKDYEEQTEEEFNPYVSDMYALSDKFDENEIKPPYLPECIEVQSVDLDCLEAVTSIGKPNSTMNYDTDGIIVSALPVDRASQQLVSAILRSTILRLCHYSLLVGSKGERRMYDKMRRNFYWSHRAKDA